MSTVPAPVGHGTTRPTTLGALCMLLAVLCFTALDAIGKHLVVIGVPPVQAVWGRYAFSALPLLMIPLFSDGGASPPGHRACNSGAASR